MEAFLEYGVLGVLAIRLWLDHQRQTAQDERQYAIESNHMNHQTEALNQLKSSVDHGTEASKAVVKAVESCGMVQNARDGLH